MNTFVANGVMFDAVEFAPTIRGLKADAVGVLFILHLWGEHPEIKKIMSESALSEELYLTPERLEQIFQELDQNGNIELTDTGFKLAYYK